MPARARDYVMPLDRTGWLCFGLGLPAALLLVLWPFGRFVLHYLSILVHELGHAFFAWLFGHFALPAFDFLHGGGFAPTWDQSWIILAIIYCGWAYLFYLFRRRPSRLAVFGVLLGLYVLVAHTWLRELLFVFMGHGFELVIAAVFLYRALSGSAVLNPLERPLYGILGWFMVLIGIRFSWLLLTDQTFIWEYRRGKMGVHNDFIRLGEELLGVGLSAVTVCYLLLCLFTPALAVLVAFYRKPIWPALNRWLDPRPVEPTA